MFDLLKKIYYKIETLKGKKLYMFLLISFVVFVIAGLIIGYFTAPELSENEGTQPRDWTGSKGDINKPTEVRGKVSYVDPTFYPEKNISFRLLDSSGNQIALLKMTDPSDRSLEVVEGLTVTVKGRMTLLEETDEKLITVSSGGVIISKDVSN